MSIVKSLCVYCGSSHGHNPNFTRTAEVLGRELAKRRIRLVYGGGRVGLMGTVADAVMAQGGQVLGVIPRHLEAREVGHRGLTELVIVDSMHTRKRLMFDAADAFAVLPGGFGTLDELFEIVTWRQLGIHDKPVVILDVDGYWSRLAELFDHVIEAGFALGKSRQHFSIVHSIGRLFDLLAAPAETAEPDHPERL